MTNLHDFIDALRADRVWVPSFKHKLKTIFPEQCAWISANASEAVCFDMGDTKGVPQLTIIPALMRMPYPCTWLESQLEDGLLAFLACEVGEGLLHVAVLNKRLRIAWQLVSIVEVFTGENGDLRCSSLATEDIKKDDSNFRYAARALAIMARFVMALNCVNVKRIEHPAPKLMNLKRAAKGKHPLFSFWTLHLPGPAANDESTLGGTHASPRLHLRRGHIRQYAPGKYTWVEATVVGKHSTGMVHKDYKADAPLVG